MFTIIIAILTVLFILPDSVQAYLDPGTGSYLVQIVVGAFLGGLYLVKHFWRSIVTFVKNIFGNKKPGKKK